VSVINVEPEKLRPELHQKIDQMDGEHLELLHRIVLKLELEQLAEDLDQKFDTARDEGKLDRVDDIIREVRSRRPDKMTVCTV
jgi:hypothetical protein